MPFLAGAFGAVCKQESIKKYLIDIQSSSLKVLTIVDNDIHIVAGYTSGEGSHSDEVVPLSISGLIIGKLFEGAQSVNAVTPEIADELMADPHTLTKNFWGRYSGIMYDRLSRQIILIRDPLGLSTLFYYALDDGILFATELSHLYDMLPEKPALNEGYFVEYLINQNHVHEITPFVGVKELLPGKALYQPPKGFLREEFLWNSPHHDFSLVNKNEFEEEIVETLKLSIRAWTRHSSGICIELSGGLDSSAVSIMLKEIIREDQSVIAINYFDSETLSSNECAYAQDVGNSCDIPLLFFDKSRHPLIDALPTWWRPNKPTGALISYGARVYLEDLVRQNKCDSIINGQGGDHVFLSPPPKYALTDALLDGSFKKFFSALKELSDFYRMPWWALLMHNGMMLKNCLLGEQRTFKQQLKYLNPQWSQTPKGFFLKDILKGHLPGKISQIELLYHAAAYSENVYPPAFTRHTHPLLSQPVIQHALKIPSYESFGDGFDRIFLRRAASRIKNIQPLWRTMKGRATGSMVRSFNREFDSIKSLLENGMLNDTGIINMPWVAGELRKIQHGYQADLWPLLHMIACERWFNQWVSK